MKDSCCVSIIIDDEHRENFPIDKLDNIDKICGDLIVKYKINSDIKDKLCKKLKTYIITTHKNEKSLNTKAKEIINRLYNEEMIKAKNQNKQIEETKTICSSPKIINEHNNNNYSKNKKEIINTQISRILKYVNEVDQCKQFTINEYNSRHSSKNRTQKRKSIKSSLKFIDRDLQREAQNDLFIPNVKYQNSFNNELNLHLNNTELKKTNLDFTTSRIIPTKDSYAEIYKNQILLNSMINNSTVSVRTRPLSKSLTSRIKTINGTASKNKSNDNLYQIKEKESSSIKGKDSKVITITTVTNETLKREKEEKEKIKREQLKNDLKVNNDRIKKNIKEINDNMPDGFVKLFQEEKKTKLKKQKNKEKIEEKENYFTPTINQRSKEICLKNKNRNTNCVSRLFSQSKKETKKFERIGSSPSYNTIQNKTISSPYSTNKHFYSSQSIILDKQRIREKKSEEELIKNCEEYNKKRNNLRKNSLHQCEKHLNHYKLNNFKNIYEQLAQYNIQEIDIDKVKIDNEIKEKLVCPVLHILKARNLEFNFQNFYILCNELLSYVEKESL